MTEILVLIWALVAMVHLYEFLDISLPMSRGALDTAVFIVFGIVVSLVWFVYVPALAVWSRYNDEAMR